jgi:hypothetical protein
VGTDYELLGEADLSHDGFYSFIQAAVDGRPTESNFMIAEGMGVYAERTTSGDERSAADRFGFTHRVSATFRLSSHASEEVLAQAEVVMYRTVIEFFERFPGRGVLLYNGEEVTIQKLDNGIEINSDWEEWTDNPGLQPLINGYPYRPLPQPLL